MLRYVVQRLGGSLLVLWVIVTLAFFLMRLAPGGPFDLERTLPLDVQKNIAHKYHLDEPLLTQYLRYISDIAMHGDLGPSYKYADRSVNDFIADGLPITLQLGTLALTFALVFGLTFGIVAALRHNTAWDYVAMGLAIAGVSIPNFVVGPLLQYLFGLKLGWVPIAGWDTPSAVLLPSLTLGVVYAASIARLARGGMLEVLGQDYIRTARAKGLRERVIIVRHMLRGGLLPVISYLGPAVAFLLSGSLVVEKIFNIPGLGRHFVQSALNRDYTVTLGMVIFFSGLILACNLCVDLLYLLIDPRVREATR
ncbi:MAG: ABC transporter permease subunit [Deltaproteobacteria bacterium]|nr:ABC transporter permease subunit [Deltaproteobacteria bacterium]